MTVSISIILDKIAEIIIEKFEDFKGNIHMSTETEKELEKDFKLYINNKDRISRKMASFIKCEALSILGFIPMNTIIGLGMSY